jgi:hypothetical protein
MFAVFCFTTFNLMLLLTFNVQAADIQASLPDLPGTTQVQTLPESAPNDENNKTEVIWEWDAYYTDVDINIPLTDKPIPTISSASEWEIYTKLIEGSAIPRYMLLEASVYPMPILGTYLKKHSPQFYQQGQLGKSSINIIESVTAGFQEPWAISAFFGNIAKLERPGQSRTGSNMGYTGYLISAGTKHIKNNVLIEDNWYELEWKIKGKIDYPKEKMNWSFRIGSKSNSNPDVSDVMYFAIHRYSLDYRAPFLQWLGNSDIDVRIDVAKNTGRMVRGEFVFGKKYPMADKDYTASLDVGILWDSPNEYSGILRDRQVNTVTLLFRPSIQF